jgi:hypothetical protein
MFKTFAIVMKRYRDIPSDLIYYKLFNDGLVSINTNEVIGD